MLAVREVWGADGDGVGHPCEQVCGIVIYKKNRPSRDLNPKPPDPKSGALPIEPDGRTI